MTRISVKIDGLSENNSELEKYSNTLTSIIDTVDSARESLAYIGSASPYIKNSIKIIKNEIVSEQQSLKNISSALSIAIRHYADTENKLAGQAVSSQYINSKYIQDPLIKVPDSSTFDIYKYIYGENYDHIWKEVLYGDFYTGDPTVQGILLSVIIGMVPIVGQIADCRDLVADIYNLCTDGQTAEEWASLILTTIGFIPGLGDGLKKSDEIADVIKRSDIVQTILQSDIYKHVNTVSDVSKEYIHSGRKLISSKTDPLIKKAIHAKDKINKEIISEIQKNEYMKTFIKKGKRISKDILEELDQVQFSIPALDTQNIHIDGVDVTGNLLSLIHI